MANVLYLLSGASWSWQCQLPLRCTSCVDQFQQTTKKEEVCDGRRTDETVDGAESVDDILVGWRSAFRFECCVLSWKRDGVNNRAESSRRECRTCPDFRNRAQGVRTFAHLMGTDHYRHLDSNQVRSDKDLQATAVVSVRPPYKTYTAMNQPTTLNNP